MKINFIRINYWGLMPPYPNVITAATVEGWDLLHSLRLSPPGHPRRILEDSSPANPRCVTQEHEKRAIRLASLMRRLSPRGGLKLPKTLKNFPALPCSKNSDEFFSNSWF